MTTYTGPINSSYFSISVWKKGRLSRPKDGVLASRARGTRRGPRDLAYSFLPDSSGTRFSKNCYKDNYERRLSFADRIWSY